MHDLACFFVFRAIIVSVHEMSLVALLIRLLVDDPAFPWLLIQARQSSSTVGRRELTCSGTGLLFKIYLNAVDGN